MYVCMYVYVCTMYVCMYVCMYRKEILRCLSYSQDPTNNFETTKAIIYIAQRPRILLFTELKLKFK